MNKCPCYQCEDRVLGCKSNCQRYIEWKSLHEEERVNNYKAKMKARQYDIYKSEKKLRER